ncbi:MAG: hypothetical protein WCA11_07110, partial [Terracidiphilus sp.]
MKRSTAWWCNSTFFFSVALACPISVFGQTTTPTPRLPDAPSAPLMALARQSATGMPPAMSQAAPTQTDNAASGQNPRLTQADAERMAINDRILLVNELAAMIPKNVTSSWGTFQPWRPFGSSSRRT